LFCRFSFSFLPGAIRTIAQEWSLIMPNTSWFGHDRACISRPCLFQQPACLWRAPSPSSPPPCLLARLLAAPPPPSLCVSFLLSCVFPPLRAEGRSWGWVFLLVLPWLRKCPLLAGMRTHLPRFLFKATWLRSFLTRPVALLVFLCVCLWLPFLLFVPFSGFLLFCLFCFSGFLFQPMPGSTSHILSSMLVGCFPMVVSLRVCFLISLQL
jgi:hypothetical protein